MNPLLVGGRVVGILTEMSPIFLIFQSEVVKKVETSCYG